MRNEIYQLVEDNPNVEVWVLLSTGTNSQAHYFDNVHIRAVAMDFADGRNVAAAEGYLIEYAKSLGVSVNVLFTSGVLYAVPTKFSSIEEFHDSLEHKFTP